MAARDLAAFAFIPPGKKNSRGARRLRQIEVGYNMLPQVRRGVTERRRALVAPPGRPGDAATYPGHVRSPRDLPRHQPAKRYKRVGYPYTLAYRRGNTSSGSRPGRICAAQIIGYKLITNAVRPALTHTRHICRPGRIRPPSRDRPPGTGRDEAVNGRYRACTGEAARDQRITTAACRHPPLPTVRSPAGRHDVTSCRLIAGSLGHRAGRVRQGPAGSGRPVTLFGSKALRGEPQIG